MTQEVKSEVLYEKEQHNLETRMAAYETQYQMASGEFYRRFRAGELGDAMDFVEWRVFYEMHQVILARIETLGVTAE